jgi:membrane-bound serine protease (ClpP class)
LAVSVAFGAVQSEHCGLFFELSNPGSVFPGVLGAIFLVVAFYSLHMLPTNYAGVLLIILGLAFFVAEIWVTSAGLLTVGGIVSMFFGSLMLINPSFPFLQVSYRVIIPAVAATAIFFIFAVGKGLRAQFLKPTTGREGLVPSPTSAGRVRHLYTARSGAWSARKT